MKLNRLAIAILAIASILVSCNGGGKIDDVRYAFLENLDITINQDLLLKDSLTLPDAYCGDKDQKIDGIKGLKINRKQYEALILPAGKGFADEMSNWVLLGVRPVGNDITLAAFYAGNGVGYCVDLITYDSQGNLLDAINGREMHLVWRCDLTNADDDNSFTLDSQFTFESDDHLTLHRVMGKCLMDFDKDLKGKPQWQQGWDQEYLINSTGHFVLQGQKVVMEQGEVDHYAALDFKSWDMLVCSQHDPSIMNTWNEYAELVNSTYDPDYEYNPFPWDVAQLYHMNPQRFLLWMVAKRSQGNHLLPQFKLPPDERPALLQEISQLDDANARQWLTAIVNNWDDKPLTKHI